MRYELRAIERLSELFLWRKSPIIILQFHGYADMGKLSHYFSIATDGYRYNVLNEFIKN